MLSEINILSLNEIIKREGSCLCLRSADWLQGCYGCPFSSVTELDSDEMYTICIEKAIKMANIKDTSGFTVQKDSLRFEMRLRAAQILLENNLFESIDMEV